MVFTFTPQDAQIVLSFLASILVPFVVSLIKRQSWPSWLSVVVVVVVSLIAGALSQYASGTLTGGSVIAAAALIFAAAQAYYATWFQALGFETVLNPPQGDTGAATDAVHDS